MSIKNPIAYVEIPVTDLARAMAFYRQVFGFTPELSEIDATLAKARAANATVLYAKKAVGAFGYVAEIKDSEGNRIALNEPAQSQ